VPSASDLSIEIAEQGRGGCRVASVQQPAEHGEELADRRASWRQLFARRAGRDASREVPDHGRGTSEHVRGDPEHAGEDVPRQSERELVHAPRIVGGLQRLEEVLRPPPRWLADLLLEVDGRGRHRRLQRRVFRAVVHSYEASEDGAGR